MLREMLVTEFHTLCRYTAIFCQPLGVDLELQALLSLALECQ